MRHFWFCMADGRQIKCRCKEEARMAKETKYGAVETERGKIGKDEPVFILRAQDRLAPDAIRMYAALRRARGDEDEARACEMVATQFDIWTGPKKYPD